MLLERAAGSEDAFDAAVSALVMGAHADELAARRRPPMRPSASRGGSGFRIDGG